jgi:hypothetical protein
MPSLLVPPPLDHAVGWCLLAGWVVAALGGAAGLFDDGHDPLRGVVEAAFAAQVEDLALAAEHGGDDPCFSGELVGEAG